MKSEWTAKEIAEILGVSKRAITKRARNEHWPHKNGNNHKGGGNRYHYSLSALPADVQQAVVARADEPLPPEDIIDLAPSVQLEAWQKLAGGTANLTTPQNPFTSSLVYSPSGAGQGASSHPDQKTLFPGLHFFLEPPKDIGISPDVLRDSRVSDIARIVQEADDVPLPLSRGRHLELVAIKYGIDRATLYRYRRKYNRAGLPGLKHRKSTRGHARSWTPEAVDFWLGLCLKREHRRISKKSLYDCLRSEAAKRSWQIGSYSSALWWFNARVTPQLLALQRGGTRALDNTLPPICRDYSDLAPFEILVGDQHRFDFWVLDDDTGQVFRPEGYFWQDLRTRVFYGGAIAERYNAQLMGLALRIGLRRFGAFGGIYTDHGKPEESRYIMGITKEMRGLGLGVERSADFPLDMDAAGADPEETRCRLDLPNGHRKAIVRNAKAKMIEGTFNALEGILRNHIRLPGNVKRLTDSKEWQEIDHDEALRLARSGKLTTFREFVLAVYRAMDFYNSEKPHRGVLAEWLWSPKPEPGQATPMRCLLQCYSDGWRPRRLSEDAVDLVFLPRETRTVDRGRIVFQKERYEAEALIGLNGRRVEIRSDPLDRSYLLVFHGGQFLCRAEPVEYSSMTDRDLSARKINEKARLRKLFIAEYRNLTSPVPDFREYSTVPSAERPAALVGTAKREALERRRAEAEYCRVMTPEELAAGVAAIENYRPTSYRPVFSNERDRYEYVLGCLAGSGDLEEGDERFMHAYESKMSPDARAYWNIYKDSIGLGPSSQAQEGGKT
jgi:putative transposase